MSNILNRDAQDALADKLEVNDSLNRWGNVVSSFLQIPGLVALWPMSSIQVSTGYCYDISGQNRILTSNGNPQYGYENLIPYIALDGTGDYLLRADEADLSITGTETWYENPGITWGGWFWFNNVASGNEYTLSKLLDYYSRRTASEKFFSVIINSAGVSVGVTSNDSVLQSGWYWLVSRFTPSLELANWVNRSKTINTTSIVSNCRNGVNPLTLGSNHVGGELLNGKVSLSFLSANAISDSIINGLFEQSRILFGV